MSELVEQAKMFAVEAHRRIKHVRKYTKQPYDIHLKSVARLVGEVTDDPEMIAAAWLHDIVEDTTVTFQDLEQKFGAGVTQLVTELTDVSKPSDGNRFTRKAIDREHTAQASPRAKTIKLADLIDNCTDICRNDPRFARVYAGEMAALLEVLKEGNATLLKKAGKVLEECAEGLGSPFSFAELLAQEGRAQADAFSQRRALRLFTEVFTAKDIAEPILSFDCERTTAEIAESMAVSGVDVVGIRNNGVVNGYVRKADLGKGAGENNIRMFGKDQIVDGDASLSDVILLLTRHEHCFVALLGIVGGYITREHIQKPIVRMWLFGMIMLIEMSLVNTIRVNWPDESWTEMVSDGRLQKAKELLEKRHRKGQNSNLLECLQISDKAQIVIQDPQQLAALGFDSKKTARRVIKDLESLRNNLAHGQNIVTHDWPQIARMTQRIEEIAIAHG